MVFFDVGLEDLGRRTGLHKGLEPIRPSSSSPSSPVLQIILVVVEDGLFLTWDLRTWDVGRASTMG